MSHAVNSGIQDNMSFQQCLELPRAIATIDGNPVKGNKANTTKVYEKRYDKANPSIMTTSLPEWAPETVVMEGMFLININPWSTHKNMGNLLISFLSNISYLITETQPLVKYTYYLITQIFNRPVLSTLRDSTETRQTAYQMITTAVNSPQI